MENTQRQTFVSRGRRSTWSDFPELRNSDRCVRSECDANKCLVPLVICTTRQTLDKNLAVASHAYENDNVMCADKLVKLREAMIANYFGVCPGAGRFHTLRLSQLYGYKQLTRDIH